MLRIEEKSSESSRGEGAKTAAAASLGEGLGLDLGFEEVGFSLLLDLDF
jgi:hypothetical protein